MSSSRSKLATVHIHKAFPDAFATDFYERLRDGIEWEEGIPSRKHGRTRLAKSISFDEVYDSTSFIAEIKEWIDIAISRLYITGQYEILGTYLNYYADGEMWTPSHSHPGQHQIVISLGESRTFHIGKKKILLENGDVVLFGSSAHSIPKEPNVLNGRISIATFMRKL